MAMGSLAGEPAMILGAVDDSKRGPYFNAGVNQRLVQKGEWSDDLWNCCDGGVWTCACSFFCPCVIIYQMLERMGRILTPAGVLDKTKYAVIVALLLSFDWFVIPRLPSVINPVIRCHEIHPAHGHIRGYHVQPQPVMAGPVMTPSAASGAGFAPGSLPLAVGEPASTPGAAPDGALAAAVETPDAGKATPEATQKALGAPSAAGSGAEAEPAASNGGAARSLAAAVGGPAPATYVAPAGEQPAMYSYGSQAQEKKVHRYCTTVWSALAHLAWWFLTFLVVKGLRQKLNVKENDILTFAKTACCPDICLCCQCCYLSQVSRHVDRVQGFVPIPDAEQQMGMYPAESHFDRTQQPGGM
eukprot:TRINITY_DN38334_c0_g1_i1.p1 TRINITY_DN38334_c0_g1~~TRINITY_DN38334_c0_g1_i1.p1  ORF type:complete len:378 (-),score=80.67 TRINITY_DN38334_c0_g1_i1:40-1110(-)